MLHILSDKKKRKFYEENLNKDFTVLWEGENDNGFMYGFTENYVKVTQPYNEADINEMRKVNLKKINSQGIVEIETLA